MREILSIHLGQAGVQIGSACWELYTAEHCIDRDGFSRQSGTDISTFFQPVGAGKCVPRSIFLDLESNVLDTIRTGAYRELFSKDMIITGSKEDAANNFARGYFNVGTLAKNIATDKIRTVVESYDSFQGFLVFHSYGGGTGSGLGSLMIQNLKNTYSKKNLLEVGIFPSPRFSSAIVEPYNAVLATHAIMDSTDCCLTIDNESVYRICHDKLHVPRPTFVNINRLIAQALSSVTSSLRFKSVINANLKEIETNLIPYPRIHFPIMSYAPIVPDSIANFESIPIKQLICDCFEPRNQFVKCNPHKGKYIACCVLFRGDVTPNEVNTTIRHLKMKRCIKFVDWCPTGFKLGFNLEPPSIVQYGDLAGVTRSCCTLSNTTAVVKIWDTLAKKFNSMFSRRAFVHWYIQEGLEFDQFKQAREDIAALEKDYNELEVMECCCNPCPGEMKDFPE